MKKCLKITFTGKWPKNFLHDFVQKHARKFDIEGTVQKVESLGKIRIIACGMAGELDDFLDILHAGGSKISLEDIEIEPFLKDKDYRGVFRVIE